MRAGSARPGSSARRPDTGASLDYLASPAGTPVRAGSAGGASCALSLHLPVLMMGAANESLPQQYSRLFCVL